MAIITNQPVKKDYLVINQLIEGHFVGWPPYF
jgi:hypothetical protein